MKVEFYDIDTEFLDFIGKVEKAAQVELNFNPELMEKLGGALDLLFIPRGKVMMHRTTIKEQSTGNPQGHVDPDKYWCEYCGRFQYSNPHECFPHRSN